MCIIIPFISAQLSGNCTWSIIYGKGYVSLSSMPCHEKTHHILVAVTTLLKLHCLASSDIPQSTQNKAWNPVSLFQWHKLFSHSDHCLTYLHVFIDAFPLVFINASPLRPSNGIPSCFPTQILAWHTFMFSHSDPRMAYLHVFPLRSLHDIPSCFPTQTLAWHTFMFSHSDPCMTYLHVFIDADVLRRQHSQTEVLLMKIVQDTQNLLIDVDPIFLSRCFLLCISGEIHVFCESQHKNHLIRHQLIKYFMDQVNMVEVSNHLSSLAGQPQLNLQYKVGFVM